MQRESPVLLLRNGQAGDDWRKPAGKAAPDKMKPCAMSSFVSFSDASRQTPKLNRTHSLAEALRPEDHFRCSSAETSQKASQTARIAFV